ncbi:MAG TPA: glycosyltransferase family 2 protein [Anaerolineaceae bacterium]|nr:glycosyltransferase family 2 protein [Anaerolineaceae bacterium]
MPDVYENNLSIADGLLSRKGHALLYILLPAYNEEKDLGALMERIHACLCAGVEPYTLVVVNDGSSDRTLQVAQGCAQRMPVMVLDHGVNKGLGQAMRTGIRAVVDIAAPEDVLIAMDADNTHDTALIPGMIELIRAGKDVVIASRYQQGGKEIGLAYHRHVLSKGINTGLSVLFPIRGARDYTCGYRAYRIAALQQAFAEYGDAFIEEHGFTCMAEILLKMARLGVAVDEVPLILRYDYKSGASKMKVARTIRRYFTLIWHVKFQLTPPRHPISVSAGHSG